MGTRHAIDPRTASGCAAPEPAPLDPQLWIEVEQERGDAVAAEHRVYSRILDLAMEIQSGFHYVGYVFFVLMGLLFFKKKGVSHTYGRALAE